LQFTEIKTGASAILGLDTAPGHRIG
jgi:hypothetical protein